LHNCVTIKLETSTIESSKTSRHLYHNTENMHLFKKPKTRPSPAEEPQSNLVKDREDFASMHSTSSIDSESDAPPAYSADSRELEYTSIRLKRSSNSCALVRGSDSNHTPLIGTIYRWGPGRHPRMRILPPQTSASVEEVINSDHVECELVEVRNSSMISRTQKMVTSFGTFEWRYGSRAERKEAYDAASLLIMERTDLSSSAGGKMGKHGVRVAQLVRNDEFRTPGTSRYMGGNGGRLMMDLSMWADKKNPCAKDVEAFMVASCICMLKREADRFRDNQIALVT
jgi:hypothetical protein